MNKKVIRLIAILMAALMVLSLAVSAFAEEPGAELKYYFCMCDSFGNKAGGEMGRPDANGWLAGSYPVLLSRYLGLTGQDQHFYGGRAGWRTNEIRYLLDDSFSRDAFASNDDWLHFYGGYGVKYLDDLRPAYRANLRKADIVTVNIGSNDLVGNLLFAAEEVLKYHSASDPCSRELLARIEAVKEKYSGEEAIAKILEILALAPNGVILVQNVLNAFTRIMRDFGDNFDAMMKAVESYTSEDTTILVLGIFNPVSSAIQVKAGLPGWLSDMVAAAFDPIVSYVNLHMKYGSAYASTYTYVDVTDVDMTGSVDGAHLGLAGHRYFFEQLVTALNSALPCDHSFGTTLINYRAPSKLLAGYSGDVKCDHCGEIIEKGSLLRPTLFG